ncbi:MAG: acyl-CoA dehydrogenase family protein [Thermogemmatispora sp.]|uniref:acyl-CoA dehydrogenase family protein n=1 Tax=Thermogemmatispora sp. TaxID=1968838 RepID=UPI002617225E|nr:acyl-CoA dehydrogenase family protein [Thermogemmatispora sp.]MBX5458796.1 acyl-CoA dehydrogenase family protein [Thermogemmatispora sp.]
MPALDEQSLMPGTEGINFYEADPILEQLLQRHLSPDDYERARPLLLHMGAVASERMDELAAIADRHGPVLRQYDRRGQRIDEVIFHPAYHELERIAYQDFAIAACTHREGALGWPGRVPQPVKFALAYLGMQAEAGVFCPVSMTDALARVLERYGDEALKQRFLPHLTALSLDQLQQGAMFLTEKQGGSDVGQTATIARRHEGGEDRSESWPQWQLWGEKWFCSNVSADLILTLARPGGAPAGTRGLGLFLVPRRLPDGRRNAYTINRLKEKLGTRSLATGEVTLEGALAYQVGALERGFVQMTEMINLTRIWAAIGSLAAMRRSLLEATVHTHGRIVFGRRLCDHPLMRRQLVDLLLEVEGCAALAFETTAVLERVDRYGHEEDRRLLRILTPLCKYYIPKRGEYVTLEALEMRGGNGYVEDWVNPRLLRDAIVNAIWEGASNVIVLDVARAMSREGSHLQLFAWLQERLRALQRPELAESVHDLQLSLKQVAARFEALTTLDPESAQLPLRGLVERLAQVTIAMLLLEQAATSLSTSQAVGERQLLVAQLFMRRHLQPHPDGWQADDDRRPLEQFETLIQGAVRFQQGA